MIIDRTGAKIDKAESIQMSINYPEYVAVMDDSGVWINIHKDIIIEAHKVLRTNNIQTDFPEESMFTN